MKDKGGHKKWMSKCLGVPSSHCSTLALPGTLGSPGIDPPVLPIRGMRRALGTFLLLASHSTDASGIFILGYSASLLEEWNCGGFPIREKNCVQMEGTALGSEGYSGCCVLRIKNPLSGERGGK